MRLLPRHPSFWLLVLGALFFIPFLGLVHLFDWDEINFAESAREMMASGNYSRVQIDFSPFWEKPPLFFWLQVLCMKVFGINEFAARLPNALAGIVTLQVVYRLGCRLRGSAFGWLWALVYLGSLLPHFYFTSGIIDPVFNLFIFLSLYQWIRAEEEPVVRLRLLALSGVFSGLAVLTKGPVGLLIPLLSIGVHSLRKKSLPQASVSGYAAFALALLLCSSAWYGYEWLQHGTRFLREFVAYQAELFSKPVATHGQPFYYHFLVLFFGCFPMSQFALPVLLKKRDEKDAASRMQSWMQTLFWTVLILFSLVTTKIVHYSSMCYLPLSYLAAGVLHEQKVMKRVVGISYYVVLALLGLAFTALPLLAMNKQVVIPYIHDSFAVQNLLVPVRWYGWEWMIGLLFALGSFALFQRYRSTFAATWLYALFLWHAVAFTLLLAVVVPRVEQHTQGTAIRFYESLQGQDVYVTTYGFKSYAQYFYFRKPYGCRKESADADWLLRGAADKPVYVVVRINKEEELRSLGSFRKVGGGGGFSFYRREVPAGK